MPTDRYVNDFFCTKKRSYKRASENKIRVEFCVASVAVVVRRVFLPIFSVKSGRFICA